MRDLRRLLASLAAATLLAAAPAHANCGSAFCPIDTHALDVPGTGGWFVDLTFQRIDQDQPRIGTRDAAVGELPSDHAEVRTLNRTAALSLRWAPQPGLLLGASVPYVDRFHEHVATPGAVGDGAAKHAGVEGERETWDLRGVGDVLLDAQWRLASRGRTSLWLSGGLELPTGADDRANAAGEVAEPGLQPGSGSTDVVVGAVLRGSVHGHALRAGPMGDVATVPWFVSTSYRRNGRGREDYRLGDEWQLNLGTAYPLLDTLDALLQLNARHRAADDPGRTDEDPAFTGGDFLFVSPGARLVLRGAWSAYLFVQLPVYQDVRGEQLVARRNWLAGLQARF